MIDKVLDRVLTQYLESVQLHSPKEAIIFSGQPSEAELSSFRDRNFPVIFKDATRSWTAHQNWSRAYLAATMGEDEVTVAITPDGKADSIVNGTFLQPHQTTIKMVDMLDWLHQTKSSTIATPVKYLQLQNGSLNLEFQKLVSDVAAGGLPWANAVFGNDPLCNIWIGNHLSQTSLHHDPLENIYCMIRGSKRFVLYPVQEYYRLNERRVKCGKWVSTSNGFDVEMSEEEIPWLDPDSSDRQPITVTLHEGECLYLPALWFHEVAQEPDNEGLVIAVNYWYDLDYAGPKWRDWQFIRKVAMCAAGRTDEAEAELDEEEA